jgi:hypothetical protein
MHRKADSQYFTITEELLESVFGNRPNWKEEINFYDHLINEGTNPFVLGLDEFKMMGNAFGSKYHTPGRYFRYIDLLRESYESGSEPYDPFYTEEEQEPNEKTQFQPIDNKKIFHNENRGNVMEKQAGLSVTQWVKRLKSKGAPQSVIDKIKAIEQSGKEQGKSKEYIMRTILDKIPKQYLDKPTKAHGPEKSGPLSESRKKASEKDDMYVEYVGSRGDEVPFELLGSKWEYCNGRYSDGTVDVAVYAYAGDVCYGYNYFQNIILGKNVMKLSNDNYFDVEQVLRKIATDNSIDNTKSIEIEVNKDFMTIKFEKE